MEIINFKLSSLYDVLDENEDLIEEVKDFFDTEPQDGNCFTVVNYRIVIPELHYAVREATWSVLDPDADPDDPDAWEVQDSVYLLYEENEKDINQWISACTQSIENSLSSPCKEVGYPIEKIDDLDCYLIFDEDEG